MGWKLIIFSIVGKYTHPYFFKISAIIFATNHYFIRDASYQDLGPKPWPRPRASGLGLEPGPDWATSCPRAALGPGSDSGPRHMEQTVAKARMLGPALA